MAVAERSVAKVPVSRGIEETLARYEGRVVFLRGAAPGDRVEAELTGEGRFERTHALRVVERSTSHVDPPCPSWPSSTPSIRETTTFALMRRSWPVDGGHRNADADFRQLQCCIEPFHHLGLPQAGATSDVAFVV